MTRDLHALYPQTLHKVEAWLAACTAAGFNILVTSTYRSFAEQDALYAQGRATKGKRVTNARGGHSFHNVRRAVDFVPLVNGKPDWSVSGALLNAATIGEHHGLEWGGHWRKPDRLHLEDEWCERCQCDVGPSKATHFTESGECKLSAAAT